MMTTRLSFALLALSFVAGAHAQWGIRGTVIHYERMTPRVQGNWLVGIDRDVSERTSIGLDLIGHLNFLDDGKSGSAVYDGHHVYYYVVRKSFGLQYRSIFFLSDQARGAYIGTQVGFRSITRIFNPSASPINSGTGTTPAWDRQTTVQETVIPLSFRLGLRGELDGWFGDLYMAVGTQLGTDRTASLAPYAEARDRLAGFTFQVGYAIGVGWF